MKIKEKLLNFWVVFTLFFMTLFFIFLAITHYWEFFASILGLTEVEYLSGNVTEPGKFLDAISNSLGLLIGAPVALAGSFVAIVLAQRALDVSERQEYYENASVVDERITSLQNCYWEMAASFREYFNNVKSIKAFYFDVGLNRSKDSSKLSDDEVFISLSKALISSKQKFILNCLESLKNPTIRSYFNEIGDELIVNSIQYDLSERSDLFEIEKSIFLKNLPELLFALESGMESHESVRLLHKLDNFYFLSKDVEQDREAKFRFLHFAELVSPDDVFLAGALLKTEWLELLVFSEEIKTFYDEVSQQEFDSEFENIHHEVNFGAAFLIHFFDMFLSSSELKKHFLRANEHISIRNEKILEFIDIKFSDVNVSVFLPRYVEDFIDFIKRYRIQEIEHSRCVWCYEDYKLASMYKEGDGGEWRNEADW